MKRSKEEILEDILEFCKEPVALTRIVYQVNLNFKSVKPYIKQLLAAGLISKVKGDSSTRYQITPKGLEALQHIKALRDLLKPIG